MIYISLIAFFSTLFFLSIYIKISSKFGILSSQHSVSIREEKIPNSGGIIFALIFCFCLLFLGTSLPSSLVFTVTVGSGLITIIGFLDDLKGLSPRLRIIAQTFFVLFTFYQLEIWPYIDYQATHFKIVYAFSFIIGAVWIINTFNFIDGADGLLATNIALISTFCSFVLLLEGQSYIGLILLVLSIILLAFLFFNWSPARLFMGDSGSLFLGSLFVIIPTYTTINELIPLFTWVILLSTLYIETSVTLVFRIIRRKQIFRERHNYHAYQQIVLSTKDHSMPAKVSVILQCFWVIPFSALSYIYEDFAKIITAGAIIPMLYLFYYFGPRRAEKKIK